MKRNLIIIVCIFLGTLLILLTGNVITIGEKLTQITQTVYFEYAFYLLILVLLIVYVLIPIWKLHHAPEFPVLNIEAEDADEKHYADLHKFAKRLQHNCNYLPVEKREAHAKLLQTKLEAVEERADIDELASLIKDELDLRFENVDRTINEWGKTVFMITTLSQNGKLDALTVLVVNFKMIADVIAASGFRPTTPQLFKQYCRILVTALFSYYLSESLAETADIVIPLGGDDAANIVSDIDPNSVDISDADFSNVFSSVKIPGFVTASLLDGFINTALTLRIGYVTKAYLRKGSAELEGKKGRSVRRQAMLDSLRGTLVIMKNTSSDAANTLANRILTFLKRKTNTAVQTAQEKAVGWKEKLTNIFERPERKRSGI